MEKASKQENMLNAADNEMRFLRRNPHLGRYGDEQTNKESTKRARGQSQVPYDYQRPRAYDPMATDRFGEELASDAAIWNIYMDEVEEHDNELVSQRQQSLDTLLLFAALFSAVLTAFLIESKDLLQQDSGSVTVTLLLAIAQSQQRMELGLPATEGSVTPVDIPDFEPSWSARWVNGIWFTALGLSLSAALIAMLAKEWMIAYLAFRPRSARRRAFIRQSRLQGLEDWWALHIIDLLPTLLHASLLLFSVGLVIYLWNYDVAVAAVLTGVIGLTLLFYIITGILGAVYEFCPFITEVSGYTRRAFLALFSLGGGGWLENNSESTTPSTQDLKALLWLATNARDPAVVDCSYQAMAGLHASTYIKSASVTAQWNSDVGASVANEGPVYIYRENTLESLLDTVVSRFEELLAGTLETGCDEPPVSRYINAIIGLSNYTHKLTNKIPLSWLDILYKIDLFWSSNLSPRTISGNNFAQLLITKQEVMQFVAKNLATSNPAIPEPKYDRSGNTPHPHHRLIPETSYSQTVDGYRPSAQGLTPIDLYKMFTQWLDLSVRLVLECSRGEISIDSYLLQGLDKAMGDAASYLDLNGPRRSLELVPNNESLEHMSNHVLNFDPELDPHTSTPVSLGNCIEILGALISTLLSCVKAGPKQTTYVATLKTFKMLAPIALRQLCYPDVDINKARRSFNFQDLDSRSLARRDLLYVIVRYAMITAGYIYNVMPRHPKSIQLFDDTLDVVYYAIEEDSGYNIEYGGPLGAFGRHFNDYISILAFAATNEANFNLITPNTAENLCCFASHQLTSNAYSSMYYLPPACTLTLLRLSASTEQLFSSTIRSMLEAVLNRMRTSPTDYSRTFPRLYASIPPPCPSIEYLQLWTHSGEIFNSLIRVASKSSKYVQPVLNTIAAVMQLAANRDPLLRVEPIELQAPAVRGFLQAVAWTLPRLSSSQGEAENYRNCVIAASIILAKAAEDVTSREILISEPSLAPLLEEMKETDIGNLSQEQWEGLVHKLAAGKAFVPASQSEKSPAENEETEDDDDDDDEEESEEDESEED
ncbi:unnamed protein product [Rhizoctonia solani]|uniref:DUF6535 domain-containing protein n=1 Tax=Rhizoctonia solani TaxID=456999 RepID=A0A8H3EBL3_9AGAM|nr:unnamed protein product [Rhizoctonia solani]